jgi:hypothetical protein
MKYVITESRLDELVQKYITNYAGPLEKHSFPSFSNTYIQYTNLNGSLVFGISDSDYGLALGVSEPMWNTVKDMFSLSDNDTDIAFMTWMKNNKGRKIFDEVYRF